MLPVKLRRDPAPSRIRYRLTRLWLRPGFRRLTNFGVPMLAGVLATWTLAAEFEVKERIAAAISGARESIIDRPQFTITELEVADVSQDLAEQIRVAAFVNLPVNSLELDVTAVRARIETLDAVERARVRALPSGVLEIRAIERIPVVVWRSPDGLQLLDHGGVRVAEVDSRLRRIDLPLIAGVGADEHVSQALAILDETGPLSPRVRGLVRVGERRWDLVLDRSQVVRLPELEPLRALSKVIEAHVAEELLDRDATVVDMRDPRRPLVRLTEDAVSELTRLREMIAGEDA